MATQLRTYFLLTAPLAALWMVVFAGLIDLSAGPRSFILYYLPVIAVFLFGAYAIYSVVYGALNIEDCADAQRELQAEIQETKAELKKRKIIDDDKEK